MRVFAIDIMSGDRRPQELLKGCLESIRSYQELKIAVVGKRPLIESLLASAKLSDEERSRISIIPSDSIVEMDESPAVACRKKPNSTVMVGTKSVKEGLVDAFFSPGNTGATLAASLYNLGRLKNVKRPAIGVFIPTKRKTKALVLDSGANMDCNPKYLRQFAIMGSEYYKIFFDKVDVRVGLLNIGEEDEKGNELVQTTYKHLQDLPYIFKGNVEPKHIAAGECDVVVCDGFVGNVYIKTYEATALTVMDYFKKAWKEKLLYKVGLVALKKKFDEIKRDFDPSEIGCAPLIGVAGNIFIGHGGSDGRTVASAVKTMLKCVDKNPLERIVESIEEYD